MKPHLRDVARQRDIVKNSETALNSQRQKPEFSAASVKPRLRHVARQRDIVKSSETALNSQRQSLNSRGVCETAPARRCSSARHCEEQGNRPE